MEGPLLNVNLYIPVGLGLVVGVVFILYAIKSIF